MVTHRKDSKNERGKRGSFPDPSTVRWRLEWYENGGTQSESFNSRLALETRVKELRRRGLKCRVANVH